MNRFETFFSDHYGTCLRSVNDLQYHIKDKHILDVGSNIGLFSKAVAETTAYRSLHLFEPSKELFEESKNLLNGYPNIHFNNVGLGDTQCEETLYKNPGSNIGWNTLLKKDPMQHDGFYNHLIPENIKIEKLDDYYKDIQNIGFIKIDVEGYERYVIEGAFSLIRKFKPFLFIEVAWGASHPEWDMNLRTYRRLFDEGYHPIDFHPYQTKDTLFVPK